MRVRSCTGQVTHALLTRPPLSSSRKKNFVRLACVKHAASVYPEPGSNSHVQFSVQFCANAFLFVCVSYLKDFTVFIGCSFYYAKNFTRLTAFAIWLFKKKQLTRGMKGAIIAKSLVRQSISTEKTKKV